MVPVIPTGEVVKMAGHGPAPKDPNKRVRGRRSDPMGTTTIEFIRGEQPPLPGDIDWPERTRQWWAEWGRSSLSEHFTALDWDYMLDTALLHAAVWGAGDFSRLAELRIRVAKFGQTPEDRARLRIQFAEADAADGGQRQGVPQSSRERRGALVLLPGGKDAPAVGE